VGEPDTTAPGPQARLPLADLLVRELAAAGITHVFGVGGTHTLQLLGALEREPGIRYVAARTELGAAYMAIGFARATRRPAVALSSTGPGALNVASALQDAAWSSTPLLHLTTRIGGENFAGALHETPGQSAVLGLTGKTVVDVTVSDAQARLRQAVETAVSHPRGPVTVQVQAGTWLDEVTASARPAPAAVTGGAAPPPDTGAVDALTAGVERSSRPVIFAGGGALARDGGAAVMHLARTIQAPVVTSYQGKNIANWTDELYLGPWAWEQPVRDLFTEADLALAFGTKLTASSTGQWQLPLPPRTYRIGLPADPHPNYPHAQPVPGDAAEVAGLLAGRLGPRKPWAATRLADVRDGVLSAAAQRAPASAAAVEALATAPATPPWVTLDMTKAAFWVLKYLPTKAPGAHLISSYLAMGTALSMAIGTSIATGDPALAVIGDGGLQMGLAELATLAEYRLPVTVLVIVDGAYGLLRDNRAALGDDGTLGVTLWNPDFSLLASAFNIPDEPVTSPDQLRDALGKPSDGPRLLRASLPFSRAW
jgi:acetolactate synthase I/II/III large subunit